MEKFVTQFSMAGARTNATVEVLGEDRFSFVIHVSDVFEGGEESPSDNERDGIISRGNDGQWFLEGDSKLTLTGKDIQELGEAIERTYLRV